MFHRVLNMLLSCAIVSHYYSSCRDRILLVQHKRFIYLLLTAYLPFVIYLLNSCSSNKNKLEFLLEEQPDCENLTKYTYCHRHSRIIFGGKSFFFSEVVSKQQLLTLQCLVFTERSHILKHPAAKSCCVTFQWTPGTKELNAAV